MRCFKTAIILVTAVCASNVPAQEMTALSCSDFRPTQEALDRFPNLVGACEGIVDRNGELYAQFTAVVRRVSGNTVTLHLPATDRTFRVRPDGSQRVLAGGRKYRARDLVRGQEIQIYLSTRQFATPDIVEVAVVTEANLIVDIPAEQVAALPTTASIWPSIAGVGMLLLGATWVLRRRRIKGQFQVALVLFAAFVGGPPAANAETTTVQKPARVVTSTVRRVAIVEAVNKQTRELKLLDANGERFSLVANETVVNFNQIEPRDRVVTEYLESVAIMAVPSGTPTLAEGMAVELAPIGVKPGVSGVKTYLVRAIVESLNLSDRIAGLRLENGEGRTIKIGDDVPLDLLEVGDEVRLRVTTAVAVSVVKADKS